LPSGSFYPFEIKFPLSNLIIGVFRERQRLVHGHHDIPIRYEEVGLFYSFNLIFQQL